MLLRFFRGRRFCWYLLFDRFDFDEGICGRFGRMVDCSHIDRGVLWGCASGFGELGSGSYVRWFNVKLGSGFYWSIQFNLRV